MPSPSFTPVTPPTPPPTAESRPVAQPARSNLGEAAAVPPGTPPPAGGTSGEAPPTAAAPPVPGTSATEVGAGAAGAREGETRFDFNSRVDAVAAGENASIYMDRSSTIYAGGRRHVSLKEYRRRNGDFPEQSRKLLSPAFLAGGTFATRYNVVAIVGPDASGKTSSAACLAAEWLRLSLIDEIFDIPDDTELSEHAVLSEAPPGRRRLFIISDVLISSRSLMKRLLGSPGDLGAFDRLCRKLGSARLILTISEERLLRLWTTEFREAIEYREIFRYDYAPQPCTKVLLHHLERLVEGHSGNRAEAAAIMEQLGEDLEQRLVEARMKPPRLYDLADSLFQKFREGGLGELRAHVSRRLADFSQVDDEVKSFLETLPSNEDRTRAIQLAFLEGCEASEFWRLSELLQPNPPPRRPNRDWYGDTASARCERLRAITVKGTHPAAGQPSPEVLRYRARHIAPALRRYARRELPDLVRHTLGRLTDELPSDPGLRTSGVGAKAVGLMASLDWPRVAALLGDWVRLGRQMEWDDLAAPALAAACVTEDGRRQADALLACWTEPNQDEEPWARTRQLAAAAYVYQCLGTRQLGRAATGLRKIVGQVDLSPFALILPFDSFWTEDSKRSRSPAFIAFIMASAQVSDRDGEDERQYKLRRYLDLVDEARKQWNQRKWVLESLQRALFSLAFSLGEAGQIINLLCDWLAEPEIKEQHTIRLTASLIVARSLQQLILEREEDAVSPDPLLILLQNGAETADAVSELFAVTLARLYAIKLAGRSRLSSRFSQTLKDWCAPGAASHAATLVGLFRRTRRRLAAENPAAARYFDAALSRDWLAAHNSESIRTLAQAIML